MYFTLQHIGVVYNSIYYIPSLNVVACFKPVHRNLIFYYRITLITHCSRLKSEKGRAASLLINNQLV